jgi:hypothetical protein
MGLIVTEVVPAIFEHPLTVATTEYTPALAPVVVEIEGF